MYSTPVMVCVRPVFDTKQQVLEKKKWMLTKPLLGHLLGQRERPASLSPVQQTDPSDQVSWSACLVLEFCVLSLPFKALICLINRNTLIWFRLLLRPDLGISESYKFTV